MVDTPFTSFAFPATGAPTPAGNRTMPDRLNDVINVKDWGAKGDNSTDDSAAIQAAITYAMTHANASGGYGGIVFFPPGTYKLTATGYLTVGHASNNAPITLWGSAKRNTLIQGSDPNAVVSSRGLAFDNIIRISNMTITNGDFTVGAAGIKVTGYGVEIDCSNAQGMTAIDASQAVGCYIHDCAPGYIQPNNPVSHATNPGPLFNTVAMYLGKCCTVANSRVQSGYDIAFSLCGDGASVIAGCAVEVSRVAARLGWGPTFQLTTTATAASGTNILTFAAPLPAGVVIGRGVTGTGIPTNTTIASVQTAAGTFTLSANSTGTPSGTVVTFAQEVPVHGCTVQDLQTERPDTSLDLYNCTGCFIGGNVLTGTYGPYNPDPINSMSYSGGTATVNTTNPHNIINQSFVQLNMPGSTTDWLPNGQPIVGQVTVTGGSSFTYPLTPAPTSTVNAATGATWIYPMSYGIRFRKVYETLVMGNDFTNCNPALYHVDMDYAPLNAKKLPVSPAAAGAANHANNVIMATSLVRTWIMPTTNTNNLSAWKFLLTGNIQAPSNNPYGKLHYADLPGPSNTAQGLAIEEMEYGIIDSPTAAAGNFGAIVSTGGGSNHVKLRYDGTNWKISG